MKKIAFLLLAAFFVLSGCTSIYYKTLAVTENPVGTKIGRVDQSEGGTAQAAKNGGISRIGTVTQQLTQTWINWFGNKLVVSEKYELIVTGE
jgi:uncharacterized protein YceK